MKIIVLTAFARAAFAFNFILCRMALGGNEIDAASLTTVRLVSGAVASGIGYKAWYAALKYHTATRAAVLQLSVPVIAAVGGIAFLSETADVRLFIAATLILGGCGLTIVGKKKA